MTYPARKYIPDAGPTKAEVAASKLSRILNNTPVESCVFRGFEVKILRDGFTGPLYVYAVDVQDRSDIRRSEPLGDMEACKIWMRKLPRVVAA